MNTKKKNKNRPKPPNIAPKLDSVECDKPESVDNVINVSNIESEKKIQSEKKMPTTLALVKTAITEKNVTDEVPKKPERMKGKKQQESSNNGDDKNKLLEDEQKISISEENVPIIPKSRKKKNNDKKQISTQEVNKAEGDEKIDKMNVEDIKQEKEITKDLLETYTNVSQEEQDNKITKKKKKKRSRHDSQKTDVDESTTNLAFKNLLETTEHKDYTLRPKIDNVTDVDTPLDFTNRSEISIDYDKNNSLKDLSKTDININLRDQEEHNSKNKKKGKKQKSPREKIDDGNTKSEISSLEKQEKKSSDSHELSSLDDSVIKAKIAKPVDKKRKVKSPKQATSSDNQAAEYVSKNDQTSEKAAVDIKPDEIKNICESFEAANVIETNVAISDSKERKMPVLTTPEIDTLGGQQCNDSYVDDSSEDIFMEVKPSKKKKKSKNFSHAGGLTETETDVEKNTSAAKEYVEENKKPKYEKPVSSDLQAEVIESDTTPKVTDESSSTSVPDIIQYPRSLSQQLLSHNSISTVIQEIPATEKIQLEIPVCTSVPIVQGSGETPEAKLEKNPMRIKLTEIDSKLNKCVEEKTDIKSKMMEVNKDMEELRLSIERSLAELTALDKGDKEFENIFEDNKKTVDSNIDKNESKETNSSIFFPMPSTLVEKPATLNDNKTVTDPKNTSVCVSSETEIIGIIKETHDPQVSENLEKQIEPPVCPSRKDNKGKSKSKKKNKQESATTNTTSTEAIPCTSDSKSKNEASKEQKSNKTDNTQKTQEKGKQQSLQDGSNVNDRDEIIPEIMMSATKFEPIEKFEDALTSSVDDVNTTFEMIANKIINSEVTRQHFENPQINIIAPTEDESTDKNSKDKQVTPPKNLLGHSDIPVPSNKTDYKKEKNKLPNNQQAKVKIKDSVDIEKKEKVSKQSQTCIHKNNSKYMNGSKSFSYMTNGNNEFVYKYNFRKVFLQSYCHVCKNELIERFPCKFCSLIFYCSQKHTDEDWPRHQPLCFAVSTISHLKDQKYIYADAKGITGQDYRIFRMQMIVSCEKILKRKLVPWEQEALLYPRICADSNCREWEQSKLRDCKGCKQISYCSDHEDHLPSEHLLWCKSYSLYKRLVNYQQTKGRLEPPMPTKILENYEIPEKINDVLASMYEEKIDMNDIQYAALTQLATAPLTVAYCYQIFSNDSATNKFLKKTSFTVHVVGAELQFEADGLNKWEVFLLHLRPEIRDLRIVLVNPDLNPSKLPLDLLAKVELCENCKSNKRRVIFSFQDKLTYHAYYSSDDFITPDIVCAFNPSIQRSSVYNGKDSWPSTTQCILKQKVPFSITSYTLEELKRDLERIKQFGDVRIILEPKPNPFASVRPDRNFITDHEIPLLFKNYCLSMVCAN